MKDLFPLTYTAETASATSGDNAYATVQIPVIGLKTLRVQATGQFAVNNSAYRDMNSSSGHTFPSSNFTIDVSDMEKLFISFSTTYGSGKLKAILTLSVES